MKTTIEMARESWIDVYGLGHDRAKFIEALKHFEVLVRADERGHIEDEWSMCVQSDLEHGVKCLNEQAVKDWFKNYPEIAKFGVWLAARGNI